MVLATGKMVFFRRPAPLRLLSLLAVLGGALAIASAASPGEFTAYARTAFNNAFASWRKDAENPKTAWEFGRACFDLAEFATNRTERAEIAEQGLAACRGALARLSNSPSLHYYLAMNLAQLARTKSLGALKLVGQMRQEFEIARQLDEAIDFAGPDRNLGMLYRDAPAIVSIGDRNRAQQHLERSVALAPDYPDNRLILAESYLKWGERGNARQQLEAFAASRAAARAALSGPAWAARWAEWESDFARFEKLAGDPPKALQPIKVRN